MKNKPHAFLVLLASCFTFCFVAAQQTPKGTKPTSNAPSTSDVPDLTKFRIHANTVVVKSGQSANLTLQWLNDMLASLEKPSSEEDKIDLLAPLVKSPSQDMSDLLAPLVKAQPQDMSDLLTSLVKESENWVTLPKTNFKTIKWEIGTGAGKVTANSSNPVEALFTAPLNAPKGTTYVTATITGLSDISGANTTTATVKLTIPIMIIKEDQYVIYSFDGKTNMVYGDGETGTIYHKPGDAFSFKVSMTGNRELLVFTDVYSEGFFPYGNDEKSDRVAGIIVHAGLAKENKKYGTSYSESTPDCYLCIERQSAGGVKITKIEEVGEEVKLTKAEEAALKNGTATEALYNKMAKQVSNTKRTYVEGYFTGMVYLQEGKEPKPIAGRFRVMAW